MYEHSTGDGIGLAVRRARHARGLTLEETAQRAGKSKGWLSNIENGRRQLDRRGDIAALAEALEVSADTLLGQPAPEVQPGLRLPNLTPLRNVLLDSAPDDPPDVPARPVEQLAVLNRDVDQALRRADYEHMNTRLPVLLAELQVHAAGPGGPERDEALRLLILAAENGSIMCRHFAQSDLGWVASERGRQAAVMLGDPVWSGAAAFGAAHARSSANRPRALLVTPRLADWLEPHAGEPGMGLDVYGMLRLSAALACSVTGDHAAAASHGEEAARVAERAGGDRPDAFELFGPANAGVWRTSFAVEAGNAEEALAIADRVEPRALASKNRRGALRMERARAHAMLGHDQQAVAELKQAERLSPAQVHNTPLVREMVGGMLESARRQAGGRDLRGIAWRMGLL